MRGLIKVVPVILILLASSAAAQDFNVYGFSTIDYNLLGAGARARAMGGAFVGLADDASALSWNPAGLIQIERTQTSIAGTYVKLKQTNTYDSRDFEREESEDKSKLSYASFVAPLRIKGHPFMASATFRAAQDRLEAWNSWSVSDEKFVFNYEGFSDTADFSAETFHGTESTGGLDVFSFGFGTGFYGDLAIGASVNIYTGSGESFYRRYYVDTVYSAVAGDTLRAEIEGAFSVLDVFDQAGANFTGSMFYEMEKFSAGIVVHTPFDLITDHDLTRRDTLYVNGLPTFPRGELAWLYRAKSKVTMPLTVAGGIAFRPMPNLVFSGDLEMRQWSDSKYKVERDTSDLFVRRTSIYYPADCAAEDTCDVSNFNSSGEKIEVYDEFGLKLDNTMQIRLGGEYTLETSIGEIPLRGGFRMTQQQYTDVSELQRDELDQVQEGFALGDRVTSTTLTFGSGIHWRQIWLDFSVELGSEEQIEKGSDYIGGFQVTRERKNPAITLNFTGFF